MPVPRRRSTHRLVNGFPSRGSWHGEAVTDEVITPNAHAIGSTSSASQARHLPLKGKASGGRHRQTTGRERACPFRVAAGDPIAPQSAGRRGRPAGDRRQWRKQGAQPVSQPPKSARRRAAEARLAAARCAAPTSACRFAFSPSVICFANATSLIRGRQGQTAAPQVPRRLKKCANWEKAANEKCSELTKKTLKHLILLDFCGIVYLSIVYVLQHIPNFTAAFLQRHGTQVSAH